MVELIWDGKYDSNGKRTSPPRLKLPFQTVETINESAQQRQLSLDMFSAGKQSDWRNRLIWGDKKYVLPALLDEFAGKVDLIYIDPPFNVGADFSFSADVPDDPETDENDSSTFIREPSIIEQKAYRDTWGRGLDSYLNWFYETIVLLRELLSSEGSIYVHLDWHVAQYAKVVLDEVFGSDNFRNEIIVKRPISKNLQAQFEKITALSAGHDNIFWYSKSTSTRFRPVYVSMEAKSAEGYWHHFWSNADRPTMRYDLLGVKPSTGQWKWSNDRANIAVQNYQEYLKFANSKSLVDYWRETGEKLEFIRLSKTGKVENWFPPSDKKIADTVWIDILAYENQKLYATQKHEDLLEKIIEASTVENNLILDCFCGSGTTAAVAEKLNRRWITCDLGRFAIHTARKRLLSIPDVKPFAVQNLGKYERQAWQAAEFGGAKEAAKIARQYHHFILDLYNARPIEGYTWLHGIRDGRMVHVGSVDSPISPNDVKQIAIEFKKAKGKGKDSPSVAAVDVLGWDFAFELNEVASQQAAQAGINVKFIRIPREVLESKAVEAGDIKFFELAALSVDVKTKKQEVTLSLTDFIIPPDDVPADVQKAISHWSQWIDYWAVDWDNQDDTFHNMWQAYRTRQDKTLNLKASHVYEEKGEYTVMVKVIDILGNDTTKTLKVKVS